MADVNGGGNEAIKQHKEWDKGGCGCEEDSDDSAGGTP